MRRERKRRLRRWRWCACSAWAPASCICAAMRTGCWKTAPCRCMRTVLRGRAPLRLSLPPRAPRRATEPNLRRNSRPAVRHRAGARFLQRLGAKELADGRVDLVRAVALDVVPRAGDEAQVEVGPQRLHAGADRG